MARANSTTNWDTASAVRASVSGRKSTFNPFRRLPPKADTRWRHYPSKRHCSKRKRVPALARVNISDLGRQLTRKVVTPNLPSTRDAAMKAGSQYLCALVLLICSQCSLAATGELSPQDYSELRETFMPLALAGDAYSQETIAMLYEAGKAVPQDFEQAVIWHERSAAQGYAKAQNNLGKCYEAGRGVAQNYGKAAEWYRKASNQGDAEAKVNLSFLYQVGRGVSENHKAAYELILEAAHAEYAPSYELLGAAFNEGRGVAQDYKAASRWYRKGAMHGIASAQADLGTMYFNGRGVPRDYVQAHMWLNIAASNSTGKANEVTIVMRESVANKMSPDQIERAQEFAKRCLASRYVQCGPSTKAERRDVPSVSL